MLVAEMPVREKVVQFAQSLVDHEQEAVSLLSYETQLLPGLLQTREYCLATFDARYPSLGSETAEQWVNARMERQLVWQREQPPVGHFILEESILRRQVGSRQVMHDQFRQVLDQTDPVHMSFQIMPMDRMPHAGLAGPMLLLETPERDHLVYLEVQRFSFLVQEPVEVSDYYLKYGMLRSQALSPDESVRLLRGLLGDR